MQLHRVLWTNISGVPALQSLYESIEQPLVPVLFRMEQAGVLIDGELLRQQGCELARHMREIEAHAHEAAGGPFSLESPKQLQEVLFGKLGLPVLRKTPTGQPSTAEDVLEELAEKYELPRLIMDYRGFAKLKSTYTDKLPLQINRTTQRVHTCYHQAVAATGRLSSMEPNLQNIPIRTPEGRRIRQAFVAPPGWCIVAADYSQIELRIMAHLSGDEGLLNAFAEDRDIHQATAAEVFGMPLEQVSADQRRTAKMINFGLIYGMSAFGLASRLGIERSEAKRYVELYFERYPGVRRYMDETRQQARERGYVETVFGRRLYLNDIGSRNAALRQGAERAAINAPMQGTAADIIKRAMIEVDRWLTESQIPARLHHAGARRTGVRGEARGGRGADGPRARTDERSGAVAHVAESRRRLRRKLGRSSLMTQPQAIDPPRFNYRSAEYCILCPRDTCSIDTETPCVKQYCLQPRF